MIVRHLLTRYFYCFRPYLNKAIRSSPRPAQTVENLGDYTSLQQQFTVC